jgi:sulfatase maturation enzyme AslB (radical SAM superfamily)
MAGPAERQLERDNEWSISMAVGAALTQSLDPTQNGSILTFVTPASSGCGLRCGFCFIDRRGEETRSGELGPSDYVRFIREAAQAQPIAAVTIQGREPLAPSSLPWTEAILEAGAEIGAETGIVTNGWWLAQSATLVERWGCSSVNVSIDSGTAEEHDRLRRTKDAWRRAFDGLRALRAAPSGTKIVVNSLMFHGSAARLADLPRHLEEVGVRLWALSPLLRFDRQGMPQAAVSAAEWSEALESLSDQAAQHGVTVIADDEFRTMGGTPTPEVLMRSLSRPSGIMRMGPDGRCTFGGAILRSVDGSGVRWRPGESVPNVLQRMMH